MCLKLPTPRERLHSNSAGSRLKISSVRSATYWVFAVVLAGIYICGPIVDPDLWWHITVGRWVLANGTVPQVDYWNMFGVGQPWRAYSWSIEVLFAAIDANFGIHGLMTLKLALGAAIGLAMSWCFSKISRDWFLGALLGLYVTASCFNHFTLRPQSFVWIYFVLTIYCCNLVLERGIRRAGVWLAIVMALWANAQITTILGIAAAVIWVCSAQRLTFASLRLPIQVGLVAFLGTLLTPYMGGEWITFFTKTGHPFHMRAIAEFQPATIMQFSTVFVVLLVALQTAFMFMRPGCIPMVRALGGLAFTLAGLAVVKFLPFAAIYIAATLAAAWGESSGVRNRFGNLGEGIERLRWLVLKLPAEGASFVLVCMAAVFVSGIWSKPLNTAIIPVAALDFIQKHNLPHPVLNDFGRGGYMIYRFSDLRGTPQHLVPIDGRTNVGKPEIWDAYFAAETAQSNWRDFFNIVKPVTVLWRLESPLVTVLLQNSEWCLVHRVEAKDAPAPRISGNADVNLAQQHFGHAIFLRHDHWRERAGELVAENCS